ncbi:hypothetical protein [Actinoplanes solisilvae]|uniref:hypothetical protein n=1 Tax=Actinoplanes solisilvae TaxID=2486853 RepID=UPI000FDC5EA5|nr:hypothetical protein [Actinoplanes solisilvae]
MNDIMNDLARLDPARNTEPTAAQWARSENFVERTMAGSVATSTAPRRRWMTVGLATVAAGVVGAVAIPALVPGAAEKAVASWTAAPSARTGDQVMPQANVCGAGDVMGGASTKVSPSDVILAEQRGEATMMILRKANGNLVECLLVGKEMFASMGLTDGTPVKLPAAGVNLETSSSSGDGDDMWSNVVGLAAPDVTAVEVRTDKGRTFQASVRGGWWGAWWPGSEGGDATDNYTVIVHTAQGTTTHKPSELP